MDILRQVLSTLDLSFILLIGVGTLIGLIVGALPGLTTTMGIALLTGITFKFSGNYALALLVGLYVGGVSGVTCFSFERFSTRLSSGSSPNRFALEPLCVYHSVNEITGYIRIMKSGRQLTWSIASAAS